MTFSVSKHRKPARSSGSLSRFWFKSVFCGFALAACTGLGGLPGARADRVLLSPIGDTLAPESVRAEFAVSADKGAANRTWLDYATPQGIELEAERVDLLTERKKRYAFNVQYPLLTDLLGTPSLSIGVRDLLGTGVAHGAFYVASTKNVRLSDRQAHILKTFKLDAGIGTGRLDGLFAGAEARFTDGITLYAEIYRHRPNYGLALRVTRALQMRAYSFDGAFFYGLSYTVLH